jgi:hypothetical protein
MRHQSRHKCSFKWLSNRRTAFSPCRVQSA